MTTGMTGGVSGLGPSDPRGPAAFGAAMTASAFPVPDGAGSPSLAQLLAFYDDARHRSRGTGRQVSFRVDVDPAGRTVVTPLLDAAMASAPEADPALAAALAAARVRGRIRAGEILSGADMLGADAFADLLGTTRVTVNTKRRSGQVLGLDGAKRGFRFPLWQLDANGRPWSELAALHVALGGAWAVYRFLVQPHGALDGLTGREALERGKGAAALAAAQSVADDFS